MSTLSRALLGCVLVATAPAVFAQAAGTDLTVRGTITPAACAATVTGGGNFDSGIVDLSTLNVDTPTILPRRQLTFAVRCPAPTLIAFATIDNRDGSSTVDGRHNLGLGFNGTEKIGTTWVGLIGLMVDSTTSVELLSSADSGATWGVPGFRRLNKNNWLSVAPSGDVAPVPLTSLTGTLVNESTIAPKDSLTTTGEIRIDGSVLMEMKYL